MKEAFFSVAVCCACLLPAAFLKAQAPAMAGAGLWDAGHFLWFTGHWARKGNRLTFVVDKGKTPGAASGASGKSPNPGGVPSGGSGVPPGGTGNPTDPGTGGDPGDPGDAPTNPSQGGTIVIGPDGTIHLSNGGVDGWNKKMDDALNSEQQFLQDLQDPGDNLDPTTHHFNQMLIPDAQQRVSDLKTYKIDASQDILGKDDKTPAPARTLSDVVAQACKDSRADYDQVMDYYKTQVKGHSKDLKYPAPPTVEYDCYACDSNLRKSNDTVIYRYVRDFGKEESDIVRKGLALLHNFALMGVSTESGSSGELGDLFRKNKNDPSKAGACAFLDVYDLSDAVLATAHHLYLRAEKMLLDNRNNYKAAEAIIRTYLAQARNWTLLSGHNDGDDYLPMLSALAGQSVDHYLGEFRHDDWRQIGNAAFILGMIRDEALMGGQNDSKGMDYVTNLLRIMNGFELTVDMDIKIGEDAAYKLAHVKGKCHVIPSFQQDSNQCYKWVVADENRQDLQGFYKEKMLQTIDCDLLANQVVSPPQVPRITYTGTKKYTARLMSLSMNFCNPGHDTIVLSGFAPNPATAGTWLYPGGVVTAEGVNGMEQYFEDINAKKKLADDGEAEKAKADLRSQAGKLKAQMEALRTQMSAAQTGPQAGANYEKLMEFQKKATSQLSTPVIAKMLWLDFLLPVKNNEPVLVDHTFDAREINPQEAKVIIFGRYTIHIENDGNGKPKPKSQGTSAAPKKSSS